MQASVETPKPIKSIKSSSSPPSPKDDGPPDMQQKLHNIKYDVHSLSDPIHAEPGLPPHYQIARDPVSSDLPMASDSGSLFNPSSTPCKPRCKSIGDGYEYNLMEVEEYLKRQNIDMDDEVLPSLKGLENYVNDLVDQVNKQTVLHHLEDFDWSKIHATFSDMFNNFVEADEKLMQQIDQVHEKLNHWQHAYYRMDHERCLQNIKTSSTLMMEKHDDINSISDKFRELQETLNSEFAKFP